MPKNSASKHARSVAFPDGTMYPRLAAPSPTTRPKTASELQEDA